MPELWVQTDNIVMTSSELSQFRSNMQSAVQNVNRAMRLLENANKDNVYSDEYYELQDLKQKLANVHHDALIAHREGKE